MEEQQNRFKRFIAVLIAVITVFAAVLAYLQSEAGFKDDRANRDTKLYALEAFGFKVAGDARANFEFNSVYQTWDELDTLMLSSAGDPGREELFQYARDEMAKFSPLFDPKSGWFDAETELPDYLRFEADTYVYDLEVLVQKYKAAAVVKDGWDAKSNTYIVHLTLLAVSLFLLGLSLTVESPFIQKIFTLVGGAITLVAVSWAWQVWATPVPDLREVPGAIESYAKGAALAHRELYREAAAEFDQALKASPDFADALSARAEAYYQLEKYKEAADDLQAALRLSPGNAHLLSNLGYARFEMGDFDGALQALDEAQSASPTDLFIQFNRALTMLAAGNVDKAKAEYRDGMTMATKAVEEAAAAKLAAPAEVWEALDEASAEVDRLGITIESGEGTPPRDKIRSPDAILKVREELVGQIDSLSTALEYTGKPPQGQLAAKVGELNFGLPVLEKKELVDIEPVEEDFPAETPAVALEFEYSGMKDGQVLIVKIFQGPVEQPSWRIVDEWSLGAEGTAWYSLSPGYSDTFVFPSGDYTVEVFVDGHMASRGSFTVAE